LQKHTALLMTIAAAANCHRVAAGFWLTISAFAFLTCRKVLLRSSLVSRHRQPRGESWKARASEPKGCVQAPDRWNNRPWSGTGGGRQGRGLLPALGRARPLVS